MDQRLVFGVKAVARVCLFVSGLLAGAADNWFVFIRALAPTILQDRKETGFNRTSIRVSLSCDDYEHATEQDLSAYLR